MGLFGDIDANEIPEDPFFVEDGTYLAVLTEVKSVEKKDGSGHGLAFTWVINEEDSEFNENQLRDWKNYYPELTEDEVTKEIKADLSRLKQRLNQIGVADEEMNDENFVEAILPQYVGTEAYVTVKNSTAKDDPNKKYRDITFVRLPAPDDE